MSNFYDNDDRLWDREFLSENGCDHEKQQGKHKSRRNKHNRRQLSDQKRQQFEAQPNTHQSPRWQ
ncbi:hypothetical protein FM038_006615 [Shewanella eurypsychrophilus]|uniref:Uncharacterized protein n=1 Tax=Shewanella eurypsychrophilus TaxID=2593656 RepID=A0ABX6V3D3_9GAMM|nr:MULTISPECIES: hypothetical protein [Shewanella]QFU21857.1 hypothetical protein FS418_08195 [Shewanella sp. YLB-09]QPG57146.1 hypothetical protein FM038_006615 [Shewanella eurypsychrophilus]